MTKLNTLEQRLNAVAYEPMVQAHKDGSFTVVQTDEGMKHTTEVSAPVRNRVVLSDSYGGEETVVKLNAKGYDSLECIFSLTFG